METEAKLALAPRFDSDRVRAAVVARVRDPADSLRASPEGTRKVLDALRRRRRLEIRADAEAPDGYRIEGLLEVDLGPVGCRTSPRAGKCGVAGGRFATDETGRVPVVPYRMRA